MFTTSNPQRSDPYILTLISSEINHATFLRFQSAILKYFDIKALKIIPAPQDS